MTTPFGRLRAGSRLRIPLAVTTSSTRITVADGLTPAGQEVSGG